MMQNQDKNSDFIVQDFSQMFMKCSKSQLTFK
jgi:hypothetical protein